MMISGHYIETERYLAGEGEPPQVCDICSDAIADGTGWLTGGTLLTCDPCDKARRPVFPVWYYPPDALAAMIREPNEPGEDEKEAEREERRQYREWRNDSGV
jgi:hypothetical protein